MMFTLPTPYAKAQSSGTFPAEGAFNGMVITYSVSGADLGTPSDTFDFTTSRIYNGTVTGNTVTVSGTVHQGNGYGADVTVSLHVGTAADSVSYSGNTPWDQAFSVSVNVPPGAKSGSFSISMTGSYNAGSRGLVVSGQFLGPPIDHVIVVSPKSNVLAGDSPFTVRATVYASDNSQVDDGTEVTFTLTDKESGTLAGASIEPQTGSTLNSEVTATFTPPRASYWYDPLHANYAGTNSITITASAGDKQGSYEILILPPATTVSTLTSNGGTVDLAISGSITSSQMSNAEITSDQSAATTTFSFTVTGESGTTGFGNITIPKSLIPYGTTPTVYIDGDQLVQSQGYTQDAYNYYVWYTLEFSTHRVSFEFTTTSNAQQFDIGTIVIAGIIGAIILGVVVTVLLLRRRKTTSQEMPSSYPPPPPPPPDNY
jgi:hypothetical protein